MYKLDESDIRYIDNFIKPDIIKESNRYPHQYKSGGTKDFGKAAPYLSAGFNLVDNLVTSGGKYSTTGGRALNTAGDGLLMTGNPYAMAAGAILKIGGTVVNRGFGNDDEALAQTNAHINSALNTRFAPGGTLNVAKQVANLQNYKTVARGNYGWFRGSDYNRDKSREAQANQFMFASARNAIDNTNADTLDWANKNYTHSVALGGPLNHNKALGGSFEGLLGFVPQQGGAIDYEQKNRFLNNMQSGVNNKSYNYTAMPSGAVFFNGGGLGYGSNFTDGLVYVDKGGTHEENPYGGVKMGIASDGQPDLVEEDEVIYDDYVYSNRLRVPKQGKKHKYAQGGQLGGLQPDEDPYMQKVLKKYEGMTYADAAKKADRLSGANERENDQKAIAARDVDLAILRDSQEIERQKQEAQRLKNALNNMTPQELMALQAQLQQAQEQEQYAAQEQAMQEQAMQQQAAQEAQMQGMSPEDMMYGEQVPQSQAQELQFPQEMAMQPQQPIDQRFSAYGGHLHAGGSQLDDDEDQQLTVEPQVEPLFTIPPEQALEDYVIRAATKDYNGKLQLDTPLRGNKFKPETGLQSIVGEAAKFHNATFEEILMETFSEKLSAIETSDKSNEEKRKDVEDLIKETNDLNVFYHNVDPNDKNSVKALQSAWDKYGGNKHGSKYANFDVGNFIKQKSEQKYVEIDNDNNINNNIDGIFGGETGQRFFAIPRIRKPKDNEELSEEDLAYNANVYNLYDRLRNLGIYATPWAKAPAGADVNDPYSYIGGYADRLEQQIDKVPVINYNGQDIPIDQWFKTEGTPLYNKENPLIWDTLSNEDKKAFEEGNPYVYDVKTDYVPYTYNGKPVANATPAVIPTATDAKDKKDNAKPIVTEDADPFPKIPQYGFNAGIGLTGAGLLGTLLSGVKRFPYNQIGAPTLIAPDRVGPYAKYVPTDKNALMEIANANAANQRALAANMSGGNGATAFANILASDAQRQAAINDALIKADAANRERAMAVDAHNLKVDVANAESGLKAAMANQDTNTKYTAMTAEDNNKLRMLNNAAEAEKSKAISAGLTGLANLIYNGANNRWNQEMIAWSNRHGTYGPQRTIWDKDGKMRTFNPETYQYEVVGAKNGGKLSRKKKKRNKGLSI